MDVLRALAAALGFVATVGALLLIPAGLVPGGTWIWPRAWIFLGVGGAAITASTIALAAWRPENFRMRQQAPLARPDQKQPWIDAVGLVAFMAYLIGWAVLIPLDIFHLRLLPQPPLIVSVLGAAACLAGLLIGQLAIAQNRFATPTIHDQSGDGQRVVDSGLYGVIRHPLYAGNLMFYGGMALWLGSTAAFAGVAGILAFTLARIPIEEAHLRRSLPTYADYARRVRWRLAPGLF